MERIFKNIQDQTEKGQEIQLSEIGFKETPYHKLLLEEKSKKHYIKRQDFTNVLEVEKRFADTMRKTKKDSQIFKRLARDLSLDELEGKYKIPKNLRLGSKSDKFRYDKKSTLNPENFSHRYSNSLSNTLMNDLDRLDNSHVQTHLKKLRFTQGKYQLSPSDSTKKFSERPLNEAYNGKLLK